MMWPEGSPARGSSPMDVKINRLDPNLRDPVESRRRAAGRFVRFAYTIIVFGVLGFFVVYFRRTIRLSQRSPMAEILDPTDVFVDWYIPNERLIDPEAGHVVYVLFGNRAFRGTISQILPVSSVYAGTRQQLVARTRPATQLARIRFDPGASPPPLNATVEVYMHYTRFSAGVTVALLRLFGLYGL
jgi:hypothetical protein